jgi:peptidoglycan-N-acetylglucosamine deacetylase
MLMLADPTSPPDTAHSSRSVFIDPTGRRWRRVRRTAVALALLGVATVAVVVPATLSPPHPTGGPALTLADTGSNPPVVGRGPLLRVVQMGRTDGRAAGRDPHTGEAVALSDQDLARAGRAPYVLQRYGYGGPSRPRLSLTFEGGPDPVHTPRLLALLAEHDVPATFFVTGQLAVRNRELVRAAVADGHAVASLTLSHPNLSTAPSPRRRLELVAGDRVLRALTGQDAGFIRLPFTRTTDAATQQQTAALLDARRWGYVVAGFDHDTDDIGPRGRPLTAPAFDGTDQTLLLHDGGAEDRERVLDFLAELIPQAKAEGYVFTTMPEASPGLGQPAGPAGSGVWDAAALLAASAVYAWAGTAVYGLFLFAVFAVFCVSGLNVVLALRRQRGRRARLAQADAELARRVPAVTVLLAAYNEEAVIARTLESLGASRYPVTELLVVDDGSSDETAARVREVARTDPRVRLVRQLNTGKAGALNHGLTTARGELIVTVDADTIVSPDTVGNLVRHFAADPDGRLGAVAGVVRVGNLRTNLVTRWQALEYVTQISVERAAQDALGAISIVPGACAAWRKQAILGAGGYREDTLAEDCDLSLQLYRGGWRVTQDDDAVAFTEAPATVDDLLKQRIRWTFGTMQAIFKNRDLLFNRRYGWLGMLVLPWYLLSIAVPLLTIPLVAVMGLLAFRSQGWGVLALYFVAFTAAHAVTAAVGLRLAGAELRQLLIVPAYRVVYEPLRTYLLYACALKALQGRKVGWNKLVRTGAMDDHGAGGQPLAEVGGRAGVGAAGGGGRELALVGSGRS